MVSGAWIWLAVACAPEWSTNPSYLHGWVVLPLAIYFLWKRVGTVSPDPTERWGRSMAWTMAFLAVALVLPLELGRLAPLYWRVFPWGIFAVVTMVTLAGAYLAGGRSLVLAVAFPLVFLASAIPWPTIFEQPLTLFLMRGVASFLATVLPLAGIPAQQEGTTILLLNCTVGVEEACSGIRSLQSSIMLALAAGEIFRLRAGRRILLLVVGFVLAMISNAGRTLALTLAGVQGGNLAMERIHDALGVAALVFLTAGLFAVGWGMRARDPERVRGDEFQPHSIPWRPCGAVFILGLIGFFGAQAWYLIHEAGVDERMGGARLSVQASDQVQKLPIPPILQSSLSPDSGSFARMALPGGRMAIGFHFFWNGSRNNAAQLYHRPDSCMPEGGWTFVGPASKMEGMVGSFPVDWTVLPYEKGGRRALLLWASWVDDRQISYSMDAESRVQRNTLWSLIANGRRTFVYETAEMLVPYAGSDPPVEEAVRTASKMFSHP